MSTEKSFLFLYTGNNNYKIKWKHSFFFPEPPFSVYLGTLFFNYQSTTKTAESKITSSDHSFLLSHILRKGLDVSFVPRCLKAVCFHVLFWKEFSSFYSVISSGGLVKYKLLLYSLKWKSDSFFFFTLIIIRIH